MPVGNFQAVFWIGRLRAVHPDLLGICPSISHRHLHEHFYTHLPKLPDGCQLFHGHIPQRILQHFVQPVLCLLPDMRAGLL